MASLSSPEMASGELAVANEDRLSASRQAKNGLQPPASLATRLDLTMPAATPSLLPDDEQEVDMEEPGPLPTAEAIAARSRDRSLNADPGPEGDFRKNTPWGVPEMPAGCGFLYKCAICGEFVYESQLDHHVLVCPDPSEQSPPSVGILPVAEEPTPSVAAPKQSPATHTTAAPTGVSSQGDMSGELIPWTQHSRPVPTSSSRKQINTETVVADSSDSSNPGMRRTWKQWKDSELAQHHEAQNQRVSQRRSRLAEELQKKEEEECTFQPKVLPRRSPRNQISHADNNAPEGKGSQRWNTGMRNQKLKQAEAQAYADLTLKPKITRFAQAWSQRQYDASQCEGHQPLTVFERLYQVTNQNHRDDFSEQDAFGRSLTNSQDGSSTPGRGGDNLQRGSQARRVPTSELLYSDALDRRERLRAMAEQLHSRSEDIAREKRQVLGRSRRYYWQMLERQIKGAFDNTAQGSPVLNHDKLEAFLISFGCSKTRREGDAEGETSRLTASLWRHLDPQKTGHTDLLTLTVFFHVLMGAVDDAARASQALYPATEGSTGAVADMGGQDLPSMPTKQSHPPECTGNASIDASAAPPGSTTTSPAPAASLAAISEEEGLSGDEGQGKSMAGGTGTTGITSRGVEDFHTNNIPIPADDDEGRRIVELLLRFDPVKLRAEFQPLYMHRMHYQAQQQPPIDKVDDASLAPEIDAQSRSMAASRLAREKGESDRPLQSHADVLLWRHSQTEAKKEEKRVQAKHDEVSACTFQPRTSPRHHIEGGQQESSTPRGATRAEVLYARARMDRERREQRALEDARIRSDAEVRGCTFRPDTAKSERSYHRAHDTGSSTPVPRGFYETRQRLRGAGEIERQKRQQREDRLARMAPATSSHSGGGVTGSTALTSSASLGRNSMPGRGLSAVVEAATERKHSMCTTPRNSGHGLSRSRAAMNTSKSPVRLSPRLGMGQETMSARGARTRSLPPSASAGTMKEVSHVFTDGRGSSVLADGGHQPAGTPHAVIGGHISMRSGDVPTAPVVASAENTDGPAEPIGDGCVTEDGMPAPLLYVDVNIAPGQPPERIVLREGQSVNEVADEFAARHVLTPVLAQRLHALLKEVLQRQEQHLLQQHLR